MKKSDSEKDNLKAISLTLPDKDFIAELAILTNDANPTISSVLEFVIRSELSGIVESLTELGIESPAEERYSRRVRFFDQVSLKKLEDAQEKTGLSISQLLSACILKTHKKLHLSKDLDATKNAKKVSSIDEVCQILQACRIRATYGAVAAYLGAGYSPRVMMAGRDRDPLNSWIVNRVTSLPSHYKINQMDVHLTDNEKVLQSKEELQKLIENYLEKKGSLP